jgi:hypothetical protein
MSSFTIGGPEGLLAVSSSVTNSLWSFGSGVVLPDVNGVYHAYVDAVLGAYQAGRTADSSGTYYDGASLRLHFYDPDPDSFFTGFDDGIPQEDLVFNARFEFRAVPEPASLTLVTLGAISIGVEGIRRRRSLRTYDTNRIA